MSRLMVNKVVDVWKRFRSGVIGELPDGELLSRFVDAQDEAAFEGLVRRHSPMVWGVCQRLLTHRQDAEDAFQTTFLVLARKASGIGRREQLANWLFGVARRAALALRRSRGRRAVHEFVYGEVPDVRHISPELWTEVSAILDEEIARLPGKYRLPLLLCCLEGRTHAEAAEALDWPVGTVAGRLSRGRELLRNRLRRRGVELGAATLSAVLTHDVVTAVPPALVNYSVTTSVAYARAGVLAATLSATVAITTHAVLRQMAVSRVATVLLALGLLATFITGTALLITRPDTPPPDVLAETLVEPLVPVTKPRRTGVIMLPTDPDTVVVELDRTDQRPEKPSQRVTVFADGRVIASVTQLKDGKPHTTRLEDRLPPHELQDLVQYVILDQEFFDFDSTRVMMALLAEFDYDGKFKVAGDTATTTLHVKTADQTHVVEWDQLGYSAIYFRDSKRIRQLVAVQKRMFNLLSILQAGGRAQADRLAALLNDEVRKQWPKEAFLTADDLSHVSRLPHGKGTHYSFESGYKFNGPRYFQATLEVPDHGKPRCISAVPVASQTSPSLPRRPDTSPRCFEDELDW
jgi:RNA polymerase sigma factor (sigma-70 family)